MRTIVITLYLLCSALMAGEEYEPAPVPRILGKDVNAWTEHLKTYENDKQRRLAMLCLAEFGPAAGGAVDELRRVMKADAQPEVQRSAYQTLGAIGPAAKPALAELLAVLNTPSAPPSHRAAACGAVAQIDPQSSAVQRAVAAALRDHNHELRTEAIDASVTLAQYDSSVMPALSRMLYVPEDAPAVSVALRCLGDAGIDVLIHGVDRNDSGIRALCAEALGRSGRMAARALPALLRAAGREREPSANLLLTAAAARIAPHDPALLEVLATRLSLSERDVLPENLAGNDDNKIPRTPYEFESKLLAAAGAGAIPALRHGLQSRDAAGRLRCVNILAKITPPPADGVSDLISRVQDSDANVRLAAAKALDAYGSVAALAKDALEKMAQTEPDGSPAQLTAALAALNVTRAADRPRFKWAIESDSNEQLLAALKDAKPWLRQEAAEVLRTRAEGGEAVATALLDALNDPEPKVQQAAARSLAHFGKYSRVAMNTFEQWLEKDDVAYQRAALVALAGMGEEAKPALQRIVKMAIAESAAQDKDLQNTLSVVLRVIGQDAVTALTAEFKTADAGVRARAAHALSSMGAVASTAVPDLIELSKSMVDSDAQAGFEGLGVIGPAAYPLAAPYLVSVLRGDLFPERRKWATWALAEIKVPATGDKEQVIDALRQELLDPDEAVCRGAHGALVRIGEPALPQLREMLKLGEGDAPYWALRVLARMKADPDDVIPKLMEYCDPGKLPVERGVAAELVGNYAPDHPEMIPVLLRVLGDREDFVARAAIRSLVPFGDIAVPSLTKLLKQRNPLLRRRAIDALEAIQAGGV
jgi:HEAT repeat protein